MPVLNLRSFIGMVPVRDVRTLPDNAAVRAVNARVIGGSLRPTNETVEVVPSFRAFQLDAFQDDAFQDDQTQLANLQLTTRRVFRIPAGANLSDFGESFFMEFEDPDTDVVRSPTVNDGFQRYYWCSPSTGLLYNTRQRIIDGDPPYKVGVVSTNTAIGGIAVTGGAAVNNVTRSYLVTYSSIYGEEGQPSPPREAVGKPDGTWALSGIPQPSNPVGNAPLEWINIYRTITGASGATTFFFVDRVAVGTTTFDDTLPDTIVSAQRQLQSTIWAPPPEMDGIISMPNGVLVGFKGNNLYFCENFRPHAWPAEYQTTVQYPIVGLGVVGNTCVVCTRGHPAAVSGVRAAAMNLVTNTLALPCLSRGSIVSTVAGVIWASEDGLVMFGPAGPVRLGHELFDRYVWRRDYSPENLRACLLDGHYVASWGDGTAFAFDPQNPALGVIHHEGFAPDAMLMSDVWTGRGLVLQDLGVGPRVYELFPVEGKAAKMVWRSKELQSAYPANFAAGEVFYDPYAGEIPLAPGDEVGRIRVWADRRLVYDQPFRATNATFRLPSGFRAEVWQVEVEARVRVHAVHMATTVAELRGV
jgi:hypothetical protein